MFTTKDILYRTIFVINCIEDRVLRVSKGELLLENKQDGKSLTKIPFQKILALFVIGHISVTTPLLEKCKRHNVALAVMKPNLRLVFFWHHASEANYMLRYVQHSFDPNDISVAKSLVINKIINQHKLLSNTRLKNELVDKAKQTCINAISIIPSISSYKDLMGMEGVVSKIYFNAYFEKISWQKRLPRTRIDAINATMDIGYTILFNFIEVYVRMFGFDLYVGVYHRLWFKRKSLICDLVEPFRSIIDAQIRKSFNNGQFKIGDFDIKNNEYIIKKEKRGDYYKVFYSALIARKMDIFKFIQVYYRCFMGRKSEPEYPVFKI